MIVQHITVIGVRYLRLICRVQGADVWFVGIVRALLFRNYLNYLTKISNMLLTMMGFTFVNIV